MLINADLKKAATADTRKMEWVPSPMAGVERKMLDRHGAETGRATSLVRYAANSFFSPHVHDGGEEFLVLQGRFSDEHGDYGPGTYVRNPITSLHKPFSKDGCVIFVKLHQFARDDQAREVIDTNTAEWQPADTDGVEVLPLHEFGHETVALARLAPGVRLPAHRHTGGEEVFVLSGSFADADGRYPERTWLRCPDGTEHAPYSDEGCVMYVKTGHLPGQSK